MPEERIHAIKINQGSYDFYLCVVNSRILRDLCSVSVRELNDPQGYQRVLSPKRLRDIGEYIKRPTATFPNSIIVNFEEGKARFEPSQDDNIGTLVIAQESNIAWVIDGQHRLYGFDNSDGKEFDLVVSAFVGLSHAEQASVFKVINSEQKGVSKSLIYDLIDLTRDAEWEDERAHEIVKALNEDPDSPWQSMVKMLGTGSGIISQSAFIGDLKPLLKNDLFKEKSLNDHIKIMKDYFRAWQELFPDAWCDKKHILCKTLGLAATMDNLPKVYMNCLLRNSQSKETMKSILQDVRNIEVVIATGTEIISFSSDQFKGLSGKTGQNKLADMIGNAIPTPSIDD